MKVNIIPGTLELPRDYVRSEGVHLSGIIRCIAMETGILTQEQAEELSLVDVRHIMDPVALLRISMGLAWEEFYIGKVLSLEGVTKHPGEMLVDGVYMTPDGESLDVIITQRTSRGVTKSKGKRIHEIKCTYKSTNTVGETEEDLHKQWLWMSQLKGYCRAAKTLYAKLHVLFVCGDYKFPISPQLKVYEIEFSEQELEENWQLMVEAKNYYGT